jgi:hypothetical protein
MVKVASSSTISKRSFWLPAEPTARGEALEKHRPVHSPIVQDQEGVRDFISSLLWSSTSADIVPTLVRSLDLLESAFLIRLIDDEDFFIGEAVGREIEQRPALHLLPAAEHCARHAHPMVREAGCGR